MLWLSLSVWFHIIDVLITILCNESTSQSLIELELGCTVFTILNIAKSYRFLGFSRFLHIDNETIFSG